MQMHTLFQKNILRRPLFGTATSINTPMIEFEVVIAINTFYSVRQRCTDRPLRIRTEHQLPHFFDIWHTCIYQNYIIF